MHAYDRSPVNITSLIPCLVSINWSSDDLIEGEYYMLIPMQYIIFSSLCINPRRITCASVYQIGCHGSGGLESYTDIRAPSMCIELGVCDYLLI